MVSLQKKPALEQVVVFLVVATHMFCENVERSIIVNRFTSEHWVWKTMNERWLYLAPLFFAGELPLDTAKYLLKNGPDLASFSFSSVFSIK